MRIRLVVLALLFGLALPYCAKADNWPTKSVRIVVAFPAGGATDLIARLVGQALAKVYNQQFYVENRPGASGNAGAELVAKAPPDGYTLFLSTPGPQANNQFLFRNLGFDPKKDFTPVITVADVPQIIVSNPKVPVKTLGELIDYARSRPDGLTFGSPGHGTTAHLAAELLRDRVNIKMVHVPYRGTTPMLQDLIGGSIDVAFDQLPPYIPLIESGKVRGLAATSAKRWFALDAVPTVQEAGIADYEVNTWFALFGPAGLPAELVTALNRNVNDYIASKDGNKALLDLGVRPKGGTAAELGDLVKAEMALWGPLIKKIGVRLDQ